MPDKDGQHGVDETLDSSVADPGLDAAQPVEPGGAEPLPKQIGRFRVRGRLGSGGMGDVFDAFDPHLSRQVAVKRIRAGAASTVARARFWREARALAQVHDPGVVQVHDIGEDADGSLYIAMQRVDGHALAERLTDAPWPWADVAPFARELARVLAAVHAAGLVHRDLKPGNVLLTATDRPVLVDFGLAVGAESDAITRAGGVVGTITYMAPEQLEGRDAIGPAADVFAFGTLLYRLLAGRHPFARAGRAETALAVAAASCEPLGAVVPDARPDVADLVAACLARDPEARIADGAALVARLDAILAPSWPARALPPGPHERAPTGDITAPPAVILAKRDDARPPRPAARPGRRRAWLAVAAGSAVIGAVVVAAFALEGPERAAPAPAPAAADVGSGVGDVAPGVAHAALPPLPVRPVVAVLVPRAPASRADWAAAFADALRVDLDQHPDDVISVPFEVLAMRVPGGGRASTWAPGDALTMRADAVVSGEITGPAGAERVALTLGDTRDGSARWRGEVALDPDDPVRSARDVERALFAALGVAPGDEPPVRLTRSVAAYRDTLEAREAARFSENGRVERLVDAALERDPGFVPALIQRVVLLRAERNWEALARATDALLADPAALGPRDRGLVEALRLRAAGDGPGAVRELYAVARRWPYDLVTRESLLSMLFNDYTVADIDEAARVAREILTIAPGDADAASRYARALGYRGRGAEVRAALTELGVPIADLPDIRADVALHERDWATAIAEYDAIAARNPDEIWAVHMAIVARILGGRCEDAAQRALDRIQRVERRGDEENLQWSYSLAAQALACQGAWEPAAKLLDRFVARYPVEQAQVALWRALFAMGAGASDADVAAIAGVPVESSDDIGAVATRCVVTALVATSVDDVAWCEEAARGSAYDLDLSAMLRARWARVAKQLEAHRVALDGDLARALAMARENAFSLAVVVQESDFVEWVLARVALARAAEAAGDAEAARAAWQEIASAGYQRLYATALWRLATAKLGDEDSP